jgi:polar amino acid transport system substrate-binding protein
MTQQHAQHLTATRKPIRTALALLVALLVMVGCGGASAPTATPRPTATVAPTDVPAASDEVLLVTGEFPPYTGEALEGGGLVTEIVTAVFAEMGRPVRVEYYPWGRIETMVENGEAWASFPYVPTEERQQRFLFSDNLLTTEESLFYYGDAMRDVTFTEFADLQPYRVGVALGYWYIEPLEAAGVNTDPANDDLANLRKLQAGRIDLAPISYYVGQWLIQSNFPDDAASFGVLDTPLRVNLNMLIVSRTYPESEALLEQFNAGLAAIQENGVYQRIIERYAVNPGSE